MVRLDKIMAALAPEERGPVVSYMCRAYGSRVRVVGTATQGELQRRALNRDPKLRSQVKERDGGHCYYCGREVSWSDRRGSGGATYDHVDPSGGNTLENVVVACKGCNSAKKNRTPEESESVLDRRFKSVLGSDSDQDLDRGTNPPTPPVVSSFFEKFWSFYPKRVGKGAAERAWKKHNCETKGQKILDALQQQLAFINREGGKFRPNPATWLNETRWEDEPPQPSFLSEQTSGNAAAARAFVEGKTGHDEPR